MNLEPVIEDASAAVHGVKPDQMDDPTPCTEWTVRQLTNHLLQGAEALRLAGVGEVVPGELWGEDRLAGDYAGSFDETLRAASRAWATVDPDGTVTMGDHSMPAGMFQAMIAGDLLVHGWDLSRATGQDFPGRGAPGLVDAIAGMAGQGRQMGIFGPEVPVPAGAPALDRVLGLSGRDPQWTPPAR